MSTRPLFDLDAILSPPADATPPRLGLEALQIGERVRGELFGESHDTARYEIRRKLGAGGMGVVYAAYDPVLDCEVALKQLHTRLADDVLLLERLRREARMMARLRGQPHIVTLFDFFSQDSVVFVVMELVTGPGLRRWQAEDRSWRELLGVYLQAGAGLHAAHEAGLVHRDFKPENVLLDVRGTAKVADFGLANAIDPDPPTTTDGPPPADARRTTSRQIAGTLRYISPEQLSGAGIDPASDQYSFCVALYEALYTQHPMWTQEPTLRNSAAPTGPNAPQLPTHHPIFQAILRSEVLTPPRSRGVPGHILAALRKGMARDPKHRFPSMQSLLAALADRPARRRALRIAAATAALTTAAIWTLAPTAPEPPTRAEHLANAHAEIDDAVAIDALRARLIAASPGPDAATLKLAHGLAALSDRWADATGEQRFLAQRTSSPDAPVRLRCLELARDRLVDFSSALHSASRLDLMSATAALADLPEPRDCAELPAAALRCRSDEADARDLPAATVILAKMAAAEHLELQGDHADAIAIASAAADLADTVPPILAARAHFLKGRLLQLAEQPEDAIAALAAAQDRVEARECLDLRSDIASRLIKVTAQNPGLPVDPARVWLRTQTNLAELVPDDAPRIAQAHAERGLLALLRDGDLTTAVAEFTQARDLRQRALAGRPSADQADTLRGLAIAHRLRGEHELAGQALTAAMSHAIAVYGADHPLLYRELHELALLRSTTGNLENAWAALERALVLARRGYDETSGPVATILLARASLLHERGYALAAARAAEQAEQSAIEARMDPVIRFEIRAASATLRAAIDAPNNAITRLRDLLAEAHADPRIPFEARILPTLNLAEAFGLAGDNESAEHQTTDLLALLDLAGVRPDHPNIAHALVFRGKRRYDLDKYPGAIADLERALPLLAADATQDRVEARTFLALSLLYQKEQTPDRARVCELHTQTAEDVRRLPEHQRQLLAEALQELLKTCSAPRKKNRPPR